MLTISVSLNIIQYIIVIYFFVKKNISIIFLWPSLLYSFGFTLWFVLKDTSGLEILYNGYVKDNNIILAQLIFLSVPIVYLLFFRRSNYKLEYITQFMSSKKTFFQFIIESKIFVIYVVINFMIFLVVYGLFYIAGGFEEYLLDTDTVIWGALAFITENITFLIIFYIINLRLSNNPKRNKFIEVLFFVFIVLRILPGTRLFLAKILVTYLFIEFFMNRIKIKKMLIYFIIVVILFSVINFYRLGVPLSELNNYFALFYSVIMESTLNDLTLIIAVENININFLQPLYPYAVALFSLPSVLFDKKSLMLNFYDVHLAAQQLNVETINPLGGMSFLSDLVLAYGPYYIIVIFFSALLLFLFVNNLKKINSFKVLILLGLIPIALNIWRDSLFISFKIFLTHLILNYLILYFLVKISSKKKDVL